MKVIISITLVIICLVSFQDATFSNDSWDTPKTPKELYQFFSYRSPQITLHHAQRAALYYHKVGEKKALTQFNRAHGDSEWSAHDGYHFVQIVNCKTGTLEAHPMFKKYVHDKGFFFRYKDSKGKQMGLIGCNRLKNHPKGSVTVTNMFWSGVRGVSQQMMMLIPIPGTDLAVSTLYPTEKYTEVELQAKLEEWSLPEYHALYNMQDKKQGNSDKPWSPPSTPKELYHLYEYTSPQLMLHHVQRAALYFHKVGKQQALEQFNRAYGESEWNTHDFYRFLQIYNCRLGLLEAHPILKKLLNKKDFLFSYKDAEGKQLILIGCNRLNDYPRGTVTVSTMFWAGVKGVSRQMLIIVPIPGTDYQAVTFFVTEKYTEKELQEKMGAWSLPEYNRLLVMYENN